MSRSAPEWQPDGNLVVKQGQAFTFTWKQSGVMAGGSSATPNFRLQAIATCLPDQDGRCQQSVDRFFCEDATGIIGFSNFTLPTPRLISGDINEGVWSLRCVFSAPFIFEQAGPWFYSFGGKTGSGEDFKITVLENENYQGSPPPQIRIEFKPTGFTATSLSKPFYFDALDETSIKWLEWKVCAPTGQCTNYNRSWNTSGWSGQFPAASLVNTASNCWGTTQCWVGPKNQVLTLFVPGVGSPSGIWTVRIRAIDSTWTWGISSFTVNLP